MSCCGRTRTLTAESGAANQPEARAVVTPGANAAATVDAVRVRYIGGASVLVSGPTTRNQYSFSRLRPTQAVDARDAIPLLRTRLFIWAW
jgi:hypothetical protein